MEQCRSNALQCNTDCDILETFIDGNFFFNHSFFRGNKYLLDFIYIVTNLNCATLLGILEQSIKLLFYFYVGNIGFRHTSSLQNILLALIVESRVLKTYGYSVVLKPMIDNIKTLE